MSRSAMFACIGFALIAGCKSPANPGKTAPAINAAPNADTPVVAGKPAPNVAIRCADIASAMAAAPMPAFVKANGFAWPPPPNGDCDTEEIADLNGDNLKEVQIACRVSMRDISTGLFERQADGCLVFIGEIDGTWTAQKGPRIAGYPQLESVSGASHDGDDVEVPNTVYRFDAQQHQYVVAGTTVDKFRDPSNVGGR